MTNISSQLAIALNELSFVQALESEQQGQAINVLCRVKPGSGVLWASLAERILRESNRQESEGSNWHTHIARVYMLRDNRLVYGWVFVIQSSNIGKTIPTVVALINQFNDAITRNEQVSVPQNNNGHPYRPASTDDDYDPPEEIQEDEDYSEPEAPLPRGYVPEADERGNPVVPREHRVRKQPMAGLAPNHDRNAPDEDKRKGSWQIEGRKGQAFRPPVRR